MDAFIGVTLGSILGNGKCRYLRGIKCCKREVIVAQLVKRSLLTPEIRGSNPVISNFYFISAVLKT